MQTLLKDIRAIKVVGDRAGMWDPERSGFVFEWHRSRLQEVVSRGCIAHLCEAEKSERCGTRCEVLHARWKIPHRIDVRPDLAS